MEYQQTVTHNYNIASINNLYEREVFRMNVRTITTDITQKRMLSEKEAQVYVGIGRSSIRKLGNNINAIQHIGSRILYDRLVIDRYLTENTGT